MLQSVLHFSFISVFFYFYPFSKYFLISTVCSYFRFKRFSEKVYISIPFDSTSPTKIYGYLFICKFCVLFLNSSISFSASNSLICLFEVHNNSFFYQTFFVMYNILFRLEKEGYWWFLSLCFQFFSFSQFLRASLWQLVTTFLRDLKTPWPCG